MPFSGKYRKVSRINGSRKTAVFHLKVKCIFQAGIPKNTSKLRHLDVIFRCCKKAAFSQRNDYQIFEHNIKIMGLIFSESLNDHGCMADILIWAVN